MIDWNIQSRAHACQECGQPFADRQAYRTLLSEAKDAYLRRDVCLACWDAHYAHGANERRGFVSQWQGVYEAPAEQPEPIQKETVETLLRKLTAENRPEHLAPCFILAVMLERKRILKVQSQQVRESRRVFIYEHAKSGDLFTIVDPDLRLDQLEEVQQTVARLLESSAGPAAGEGDSSAGVGEPGGAAADAASDAPATATSSRV